MPHPVDFHVGRKIRAARTAIEMSQVDLGKILGVTFQQVQKYEKGVNRVGGARLVELAAALGVGVDYFYRGIDPGDSNVTALSEVETFIMSAEGKRVASAFGKIDKGVRAALVALIEASAA